MDENTSKIGTMKFSGTIKSLDEVVFVQEGNNSFIRTKVNFTLDQPAGSFYSGYPGQFCFYGFIGEEAIGRRFDFSEECHGNNNISLYEFIRGCHGRDDTPVTQFLRIWNPGNPGMGCRDYRFIDKTNTMVEKEDN